MGTLATIFFIMGFLVALVGGVMGLIVAFRTSLLWGFGSLFVPLVALVFLVLHWAEAKRPFFIQLGGVALMIIGSVFVPWQRVDAPETVAAQEESERPVEPPRRPRRSAPPVPTQPPPEQPTPQPPPRPNLVEKPADRPAAAKPLEEETSPKTLPAAIEAKPDPAPEIIPPRHGPPVKIESIRVSGDPDQSLRQLQMRVSNASDKPVRELRFTLGYLDDSGQPLKEWTTSHTADAAIVGPQATNEFSHPAYFMPRFSKRVTVRVIRATFDDGTEWNAAR